MLATHRDSRYRRLREADAQAVARPVLDCLPQHVEHRVQHARVRDDQYVFVRRASQVVEKGFDAPADVVEPLAALRLIQLCRGRAVLVEFGPSLDDLRPRQAFPFSEIEFANARIDLLL